MSTIVGLGAPRHDDEDDDDDDSEVESFPLHLLRADRSDDDALSLPSPSDARSDVPAPVRRPRPARGSLHTFHRRLVRLCRRLWRGVRFRDHDTDELELHAVRYKPDDIDALCKTTKFSRKEIQLMYRGFKQECPNGMVNEDTFKGIYAQFFPQGDASQYAHYVFTTFDHDQNGSISFQDFVVGLSVLSRGSLQEKLHWAFDLYDINRDGYITRDEMLDIISSIYSLMGRYTEPLVEEHTTKDHVERVFQRLDLNQDGVITIDEFMEMCMKDDTIAKSMTLLDTVI